MRVFVYGTLLSGHSNYPLLSGATFIGEDSTKPEVTLYNLRFFPALYLEGETAVKGEVYEINDRTLAMLDRLEGYPELYDRTEIELASGDAALVYNMKKSTLSEVGSKTVIASGDWKTV